MYATVGLQKEKSIPQPFLQGEWVAFPAEPPTDSIGWSDYKIGLVSLTTGVLFRVCKNEVVISINMHFLLTAAYVFLITLVGRIFRRSLPKYSQDLHIHTYIHTYFIISSPKGLFRNNHDSREIDHNTGNYIPYSLRTVSGFFNVPH